ncbi:hypothetical protein ACTXT7_012193 [Hymenolepis weldensis]
MPENDITKTFNRLTQLAGELVKKSDKTPYSPRTAELLEHVDQLKPCLTKLISATEEFVDINMISKVADVLAKNKEVSTSTDKLASAMEELANKFKLAAPQFSKMSNEAAELHQRMAAARRSFDNEIDKNFIEVLKNFVNNDLAEVHKAKKRLEDSRLDLDSSKNKLKNAKNDEQKTKWENEVRHNTQTFERVQSESCAIFERALKDFDQLSGRLESLIRAEENYYETCAKECSLALKQ